MTTRQEKVNSLLQKEIAEYLRDEPPEELVGMVTIIGIDVDSDLKYAKVFFSAIGQEPEEVELILKKRVYEIQGMLNRKLKMHQVPRIYFVYDHSGEYAARIKKVIDDLKDEQKLEPSGKFPKSKKIGH